MDMYAVFITGVLSTYPLDVLIISTGSALTAAHFCQTATKVSKKALPLRTAFAALKFPRSGSAPWARRDGPSMAQHGSPGIHAGRPTTQNLHSASRRGDRSRSRSKSKARQGKSKARARARALHLHLRYAVMPIRRLPPVLALSNCWLATIPAYRDVADRQRSNAHPLAPPLCHP